MTKSAEFQEVLVGETPGSMVSVKKRDYSPLIGEGKVLIESYIRMPDGTVRAMSTLSSEEITALVEQGLLER